MQPSEGGAEAALLLESAARDLPLQGARPTFDRASATGGARIALLEHSGTGNLGDDASVEAALQQIMSRWPDAAIIGLSLDPEYSESRHRIPCFAIRQSVFAHEREWTAEAPTSLRAREFGRLKSLLKRWPALYRAAKAVRNGVISPPAAMVKEIGFLWRSYFVVRDVDMLVICGGGQLLDWGGPWMFPYTLFKWIVLAKYAGAKCLFLNNGAGPLDAPLSRWFAQHALAMADYVSVRDDYSLQFLRKLGFVGEIVVSADCVWGLRLEAGTTRKGGGELVVGVSPMPYGDSSRDFRDDATKYRRLIDELAQFCGELLARGARLSLFSSDIWFDSRALVDLRAAVRLANPDLADDRIALESVVDITGMLAALSRVDFFVTCRFHGVVFASLQNVPCIALSPHPKVTSLMDGMGRGKYCFDIAAFKCDELIARFDELSETADSVRVRTREYVENRRAMVNEQFDLLFPPRTGPRTEFRRALEVGGVM
jgi:polysaccharide pyruvyl transferase WcaK-like protein